MLKKKIIVGIIDPNEIVQSLLMDGNDAMLRNKALSSMKVKGINNSNNIMKANRGYLRVMEEVRSDMDKLVY